MPAWFLLACKETIKKEATPENFDAFKSNLKRDRVRWNEFPWFETAPFWLPVCERYNVSAEQFINEFVEFIQSPQCRVSEMEKERMFEDLEYTLRFVPGADMKLTGKTLDNNDFNLESLLGKYVWVKFTATWCGPCNLSTPCMLETYERYHDKGLEIVSVYVSQSEQDPVATVKKHVEEKRIPWIILSEELSKRVGQPEYWKDFCPRGVPTMLLVDQEGKIIMLPTNDPGTLIAKLVEILE